MRRALILTAGLGTFLAGLGCQHVAGRCDCTYDPSTAVLKVPSNPYATVGVQNALPVSSPAIPDMQAPDVMPAVSSNISDF